MPPAIVPSLGPAETTEGCGSIKPYSKSNKKGRCETQETESTQDKGKGKTQENSCGPGLIGHQWISPKRPPVQTEE